MARERVWLQHEVHGGVQHFPVRSVPSWEKLGWKPCDPPGETPLKDLPAVPAPEKKSAAVRPSGLSSKEKADG